MFLLHDLCFCFLLFFTVYISFSYNIIFFVLFFCIESIEGHVMSGCLMVVEHYSSLSWG